MAPPSEIQLIVKTHKTAIVIQTPLSATIQKVKSGVLSALSQFADSGTLEDVPIINTEDDFELYTMDNSRYVALNASKGVRDQKLVTWTTLYIRFKDQNGVLQDVEVTEPSIDDDEDLQSQSQSQPETRSQASVKGKGRA